ncbi:MAG: hypothetical protein GZ089_05285 [Aromatoleum sp.]|nr:hypothetical protein [Aromatoleum sp.]
MKADFNNRVTTYQRNDPVGRKDLETQRIEGLSTPQQRTIQTTWHSTYRLPATITEPAPGGTKTTAYTYDPVGNLLQRTVTAPKNDGSGATITRTWSWTYASRGRVATATDPNGNVTTTTYYADNDADLGKRGNVATVTNALGHSTQITGYDAAGRPTSIRDSNGLVTTLAHDARGRLLTRILGVERTDYTYDGVGQLIGVHSPDGSTLTNVYDGAHRLTQVQDGPGNRIVYVLDNAGNRIHEQTYDPANQLTRARSRQFDALNRLAQDLGAAGQVTAYTYDSNGNLLTSTDPLSHATASTYDALNRLTQILDPNAGVTAYSYDSANNLTLVTDPRGLSTSYAYDGLNNPIKQVSPDTGTTTSNYDSAGNLLTRTDARGAIATYVYDALNRASQVTYSRAATTSETLSFTYDAGANGKGRLTQVIDPVSTTSWAYNSQGRVASKTQQLAAISKSVTYSYNPAGQLTAIGTPSGQTIGYGYTNNRIASITVNGQSLIGTVTTQPFGSIAILTWGNQLRTFRDRDLDGRIIDWELNNGASLLRKNLSYDTASRITGIAEPGNAATVQTYQYDLLNRLTSAQTGTPAAHTQQFAYDAVGNRLGNILDGSATSLTYGATNNQLATLNGAVNPSYLNGATTATFIYNNANRLVSFQGIATANYQINALGQRVAKTASGITTLFVYDEQGHLLGEYDAMGNLVQETVWLEDLPVATLRPTGSGNPIPIHPYYVHADHLGSPRAITRPADNVKMWQWDNTDPFGANAANENPAGQGPFKYGLRFPGQYFDAETGTHYNYFRDYDPTLGRYEQSDPIGLKGGASTYGYVRNAPLIRKDPQGLWDQPPWCGILPGVACFEPPFEHRPRWFPNGNGCGDWDSDWYVPDYIFFKACQQHDRCYDTCGASKASCDLRFLSDMLASCGGVQGCDAIAFLYFGAVAARGGAAFRDAQSAACKDCR